MARVERLELSYRALTVPPPTNGAYPIIGGERQIRTATAGASDLQSLWLTNASLSTFCTGNGRYIEIERIARIELTSRPWQGRALPLSDIRMRFHCETTPMFFH